MINSDIYNNPSVYNNSGIYTAIYYKYWTVCTYIFLPLYDYISYHKYKKKNMAVFTFTPTLSRYYSWSATNCFWSYNLKERKTDMVRACGNATL